MRSLDLYMAWRYHREMFQNGNGSANGWHWDSNTSVGVLGLLLFPAILVILFLLLFVLKTYKIMFQRLIVYYIMLSLWFAYSGVVRIMEAFIDTDGKWTCIFEWYLFTSSQYARYTHISLLSLTSHCCLSPIQL